MQLIKKAIFIKILTSTISLVSFNLLAQPSGIAFSTEGEHLLRRYISLLKIQSREMDKGSGQQTQMANANS